MVRPELLAMAKRHGHGLPDCVLEEVVQEVFLALLNPSHVRFDRTRGTVMQYLLGRVLNAIKTAQLGQGLRRAGTDFGVEAQREFVPLGDEFLPSDPGVSLPALHARHLLGKIFADVEADIADACSRVWADGEPMVSVAIDLGMSRFALARKLSAVKELSARYVA